MARRKARVQMADTPEDLPSLDELIAAANAPAPSQTESPAPEPASAPTLDELDQGSAAPPDPHPTTLAMATEPALPPEDAARQPRPDLDPPYNPLPDPDEAPPAELPDAEDDEQEPDPDDEEQDPEPLEDSPDVEEGVAEDDPLPADPPHSAGAVPKRFPDDPNLVSVRYVSRITVLEAYQYPGQLSHPPAPPWIDRNWVGWADWDPVRELEPGPCLRVPTSSGDEVVCRPGDYVVQQMVKLTRSLVGDIKVEVWEQNQFHRLFMPINPEAAERLTSTPPPSSAPRAPDAA